MRQPTTETEHRQRIAGVMHHIASNCQEDQSLEELAGVAHYSPFHLQKLFKQEVGETPKQYGLQLRLEMAFHHLLIHPHKSVQEIAMEGGFSSLSVFSRAMKSQFGHSPEQIRLLPHARQMKLLHKAAPASPELPGRGALALGPEMVNSALRPEISVVSRELVRGIYAAVPFNDPQKIREAFKTLDRIRRIDGHPPDSFYGVLTPHQRNTYRAALQLPAGAAPMAGYPVWEISGGTFASFIVTGDLRRVNKTAHYFYRQWLPASGYKIAGIAGYEIFQQSPATTPYYELQRQVFIPVEPDR